MNDAPPSLMLFAQLFMAFVILTPLAFITGQTTFHNSLVGWSSLLFQAVIVSYRELPRLELPPEAIPCRPPRSTGFMALRRSSASSSRCCFSGNRSGCRLSSDRSSCSPVSFSCRRRRFCSSGSTDPEFRAAILAEFAVSRNVKRLCLSLNGETRILTENRRSPGLRGFLMSETDTKSMISAIQPRLQCS